MKPATLIALAVAAAGIGIAALLVDRSGRASSESSTEGLPARMIDGLAARVNDAASMTIKRPGVEFTVARHTDAAGAAQWGVVEKGNYPVKIESVKEALIGLADLKPLEKKTSKPERYKEIGVQDPEGQAPDGTPVGNTGNALVTLKDDKGQTLASVIVGNQKYGQTMTQNTVFVRKAGDAQSWLCQGKVEIAGDATAWIDRQIINVSRERTRSVTIEQPDGQSLTASREKPEDAIFTVQNVPAGRELNSASEGEKISQAFNYTNLDDVVPAADAGFIDPPPASPPEGVIFGPRVEAHTFDGLIVSARLLSKGGKTWAHFDAAYDEAAATAAAIPEGGKGALKAPADVKKEADELHARLAPWAFQIPEYKAKTLSTRMDELLKPLTPPAPPPAEGGGNPSMPPAGVSPAPGATPAPAPPVPPPPPPSGG